MISFCRQCFCKEVEFRSECNQNSSSNGIGSGSTMYFGTKFLWDTKTCASTLARNSIILKDINMMNIPYLLLDQFVISKNENEVC